MLTLDPGKLAAMEILIATGWLLAGCMEARGKQKFLRAERARFASFPSPPGRRRRRSTYCATGIAPWMKNAFLRF